MQLNQGPNADFHPQGRVELPPQDRQARDRIEQVAAAFTDLCGTLEDRIASLESQMQDMDAAMAELGLVKVPRHG